MSGPETEMDRRLQRLAADLAEASDQTLEEAAAVLRDVLFGERDPIVIIDGDQK